MEFFQKKNPFFYKIIQQYLLALFGIFFQIQTSYSTLKNDIILSFFLDYYTHELCLFKNSFVSFFQLIIVVVMGLGTRKPKTQEKNPTFLVAEPDPNLINGTRTQPEPDFWFIL